MIIEILSPLARIIGNNRGRNLFLTIAFYLCANKKSKKISEENI